MEKLNNDIKKALEEIGFEDYSPIQKKAIPLLDEGRDIIGQAQTGTGKTAAFGIPLINKIDGDLNQVQGIIICPTRELAMQVTEEMRKFLKYTKGIKVTAVFGGQDISKQIQGIKTSKIVVGTPGRIMDHLRRKTLKLNGIKMAILDEADEMLNMGFREDIETILKSIEHNIQIALFSATMPKEIIEIADTYQENAVIAKTKNKTLTVSTTDQYHFNIKHKEKSDLLYKLIDFYQPKKSIVFCKTKRGTDTLTGEMVARGYEAVALHGDLSQNQRNYSMAQFKSGKVNIVVATDVAARGLDINDVEAVFNYDIPMEEEYYVHRIGRTGRAGNSGKAFTFVVGKEQYKLRKIEDYCKVKIPLGDIPSTESIIKAKTNKILDEAIKNANGKKLKTAKSLIYSYCEENNISLDDLTTCMLYNQLGYDTDEMRVQSKPNVKTEDIKSKPKYKSNDRNRSGSKGKNRNSKKDNYRKSNKRKSK
ncbi:MAG TPA: DEAD/DEAH box helicase [Anaerovoracaceae bacterium]|nr:DEAD/DEAH box helicase [Anaerovoracaceae bacterium]